MGGARPPVLIIVARNLIASLSWGSSARQQGPRSSISPGMISIVCRWAAWLLLAAIVFVTLSPIGLRPDTGAPASLERFAAFVALGGAFCLGYPRHRVPILLFMVAVAGALEALQHLVPGRHGRITDAAVKDLGAAAGVLVAGQLVTWFPDRFR